MPGHLIRRLYQLSSQVFATHMTRAGYDITPVQFAALLALRDHPGIDLAGLAELVACDRPTIGGVVERLIAKGLVERRIAAQDRRARQVFLTEGGRATLEALLPVVHAVQHSILAPLTQSQAVEFLALVRKLAVNEPDAAA